MPITDPMDALRFLQVALDAREVALQSCELHPEIGVLLDHPNGVTRFTYASVAGGNVQAVALFAEADRMHGLPCFNVGIAVIEPLRGRGLASTVLEKAIAEMKNGFRRTPMKAFYLEAVVSISNEPSNRLASKAFSSTRESGTDAYAGEPIFQYVRKVECDA